MNDHPSPAARLHDVVVTHDQSGACWTVSHGAIRAGRIVLLPGRTAPPPGLFDRAGSTFTIRAVDGGERVRCFPNVAFSSRESRPPKEFVFD